MDVNVYVKGPHKDKGLRLVCIIGFLAFGYLIDRIESRMIKMEKEIKELKEEKEE